ncbi:predicted protein, partial [Nematostella vectensis]
RGLVTETPRIRDILKHHSKYYKNVSLQNFEGDVLAYVTPWNSHGYDVAKAFGAKFTYVCPVWLQIKRRYKFALEGSHDIDKGWLEDVKKSNDKAKILPRVLFDQWTYNDFHIVLSSEPALTSLVDVVTSFCQNHGFDGVVLEVWSQYSGDTKEGLYLLVSKLADALHKAKMKLILVIPPPIHAGYETNKRGTFDKNDFELLFPVLDGFSLMTYDYSSPGRPGPNAPIAWVNDCVLALSPEAGKQRSKIMMGLNFYGFDYSLPQNASHMYVTLSRYLELLEKNKDGKLTWEKTSAEHLMKFSSAGGDHMVWYPTLKSIQARLDLARDLGVSIAIWEIGQGLDYFYDLL